MQLEPGPEFVAAQIEYLLGSGPRGLQFPAEMEARFERDCGSQRAQRLWREGLISIVVFNLFYLGEWLTTTQVATRELILQTVVVTPLCLLVNFLMRLSPPRWLREGSVALMTCVISCTYLYLQLGKGAIAIAFSLVGAIVTAMFATVVMRLRFAFALFSVGVIVLGVFVLLSHDRSLTLEEKLTGAALTTIAIGVSLMSNYSLEREERLLYLHLLESEWRRSEISTMNQRLAEFSVIDKLTGLPNRRAYEERFEDLWREAAIEGSALAVIVVDVDHFKVMNDVRGHLYGDEILRRIGSLLPQALRSTADFAARYGGEEFVVLLPRTSRESAERVGERVRALIEMAGSPPQLPLPRTECLMWVTASCGVSSCVPQLLGKREELLEAADRAMYDAKADGRNRVCYRALGASFTRGDGRVVVAGHIA